MPELPEVESTRRHLEPVVLRRRIMRVEVRHPRMVRRQPFPDQFVSRLEGRTITGIRRHGKFMLTDVTGDLVWVTHLGMSGRISVTERNAPTVPHTNVVLELGGGTDIRFVDPRTFGFVTVYTPEEYEASSLAALGPDALDGLPSVATLRRSLERRVAPIKALLLDQGVIAGLGNIYADEALHRAGIAPTRPGGSLDDDELARLRPAIRKTLADGLKWGGTSLDDLAYLLPDGRAGEFTSRLRVYGKHGAGCPTCGTPIAPEVLRGRSTHWCPTCQQ